MVVPLVFLLSWLNKYACALLDHAANGVREAPVASTDMLGPFGGVRPLVHIGLGAAVGALLYFTGGRWAAWIIAASLLLFPASVGALAMHQRVLDAISPLVLWRTLRGLAHYYLLLLAGLATSAIGIYALGGSRLWKPVSYALIELLWLCLYVLIGAALYQRRAALGFEPRVSPEWLAERNALEHERRRQRTIDDVYAAIRVRDAPRADAALISWLAATDAGHHAADAQAFVAQAAQWPEMRGLRTVARAMAGQFMHTQQLSAALSTAEAALAKVADFALAKAAANEALASYAQQCGRPHVARALRENFARASAPGQPANDASG